jgi:GGDEF domain-containing protein
MVSLARKNPGQVISLSWSQNPDPCSYTLEAFCGESRELIMRRAQISTELKWTLFRHIDDERAVVWMHETNDADLILNLVSPEDNEFKSPGADKFGIASTSLRKTGTRLTALMPVGLPPSMSSKIDETNPNAVTLAGNLKEMELTGVLQSISLCKMTGRLDVQDRLNSTEVYFDEGNVIHAIFRKALESENDTAVIGDQAILNLLTWDTGTFFFYPARKTSSRSIKRKLEGLLLEGATLRDYNNYLRQAEITDETCLHQVNEDLTDAEVNEKLLAGVPIDVKIQKSFYNELDGKLSISAVAERLGLSRASWTPVVFNLITCELATSDSNVQPKKPAGSSSVLVDPKAVLQASLDIVRADTGFCAYPLFIHFLELELARYAHSKIPFSIAIFDVSNKTEPLSNLDLRKIAERFHALGEPFNMLGHYRALEFIMLLPLKEDHRCREFVEGFAKILSSTTFERVKNPEDLSLAFGIASVPSDGSDLEQILTSAEKAKKQAVDEKQLFVTARALRWEEYKTRGEQAIIDQNYTEAESNWIAAFNEAQVFSDDDERLILSLDRLSLVLMQKGKNMYAEPLLTSLVQIKTRLHGPNSLEVAESAGELAHCYFLLGKYNESEPLLKKLLNIYIKQYGENHYVVATWLYRLATLYHVQQKYEQAETAYKKALTISKSSLGADDPTTIKIAECFRNLRKSITANGDNPGLITGTWEPIKPQNMQGSPI